MPTYEFRCPEGHEFEKFYRSIGTAESDAACPTCGKAAERMMSATGFAFKGSGFYLTDYGKNAHRGEAPKAHSESAGGGSESTSKDSAGEPSKAAATGEATPAPAKSTESSSGSEASKKAEPKVAAEKPAATPKSSASE